MGSSRQPHAFLCTSYDGLKRGASFSPVAAAAAKRSTILFIDVVRVGIRSRKTALLNGCPDLGLSREFDSGENHRNRPWGNPFMRPAINGR